MRRVLVLNHAGQIGGAEMILLDVAAHLGPSCRVVLFADGPFRAALASRGIAVSVLPAGRGMMGVTREAARLRALASAPAVARQVARLVRLARDADLLYCNSQKAAVIGMLAASVVRRPVVWHLHDIVSAAHFAGLQRRLAVRLANGVGAHVIVISEAARQSWIAAGGRADRVAVVPNGIDAAPFAAGAAEPARGHVSRAALGAGPGTLVGLFGRISHWKGQDVLAEAMALLPDTEALIVGDALFGETAFRDALDARIAALGIARRVHRLGHRADIQALMAAVDIVVHCSTAPEPFGRVIVEAMLAARPVIASRDGASAEILGADYPFLVPPNDPSALAAAITRLRDIPVAERDALVAANRLRAASRFTVGRMTDAIDRVLERAAP